MCKFGKFVNLRDRTYLEVIHEFNILFFGPHSILRSVIIIKEVPELLTALVFHLFLSWDFALAKTYMKGERELLWISLIRAGGLECAKCLPFLPGSPRRPLWNLEGFKEHRMDTTTHSVVLRSKDILKHL